MGLFKQEKTEDEIRMQLAELAVKLADVRSQVGELNKRRDDLGRRCTDEKAKAEELEAYAKKALAAGSEEDARVFLNEKHKHDEKFSDLNAQFTAVSETRKNAMELHDKMVREINSAKTRLAVLTARSAAADAAIGSAKTVGSFDFEQKLSGLEAESELKEAMADAAAYTEKED